MSKFLKKLGKKLGGDKHDGEVEFYGLCGAELRAGDTVYSCQDCGADKDCVLCETCFNQSEHRRHRYRQERQPEDGGVCDCGDPEAFVNCTTCQIHLNEETGFNPNALCKKELRRGDRVFYCSQCTTDDDTLLCEECFISSEHRNHRYREEVRQDDGGFCDCGDASSFHTAPTCARHLAVQHQTIPVPQAQHQGFAAPQTQGYSGYQGAAPVDPQVAAWFQGVDSNGSGLIDADELSQALANGDGTRFSAHACHELVVMFDTRKTGSLDVNQFGALFTFIQQKKGMFESFDTDRTTFLSEGQLTEAFNQMGYRLSQQFLQSLATKYGSPPGSRGLSLDNFVIMTTQVQRLTDSFRSRDTEMKGQATLMYEDFLGIATGAAR